MKVLVVGPSPIKSKGGMSTVIEEIQKDAELNTKFDIDIYESYIDGNKIKVLFYSLFAIIRFYFTKRNYDLYHIHVASYGSTFRKGLYVHLAKKRKKKVIIHIHGAEYMNFYAKSNKKEKILNILRSADMVIALSETWKKRFDDEFKLNNCVVLENGIDVNRLLPAVNNEEEYIDSFLMLGRLGHRKGTYDLINAMEIATTENRNLKLYLAGDGEVDAVKNIIFEKKLEKNIIVVGWADFNKKLELLKIVSTVVLPSYNEGLPMAILEGMACGKAIISTTVGAIPEVVKEDNGILINPGNVNGLGNALKIISTSPNRIKEIKQANMKKINDRFSMEVMHTKLEHYYLEVMKGNI